MRPRTLLILLLLLVALAAFAWFVDRDLPGSDERAEKAQQVLYFDGDQVVAVRIERGEERIRLEGTHPSLEPGGEATPREPVVWRLVEPLLARADGGKVRALLSDLGSLESQRKIEQPDRAALGLIEPRARLILERTQGGELVLELGAALPSSESMIVARAGEAVAHVVASRLFDTVDRASGQWRDHNLFRGERARVDRIRLTAAGEPTVTLARRGEEMWLESPITDRAASDPVDRLLEALVGLQAERFLDAHDESSSSRLGLEPPRATIEILANDGTKILSLSLGREVEGSAGGARFARAGDEWVELGRSLEEWWSKPVEEWRSKRWTALEPWQVDDATIESPSGRLVLRREGVDWQREGVAIPFTSVSDLFAMLSETQAVALAPATVVAEALGTPLMTLTLAASEGHEETLALYPAIDSSSSTLPATVSGREVVLLLPATTLTSLEAKVAAIRAAEPLPQDDFEEDEVVINATEGNDEKMAPQ